MAKVLIIYATDYGNTKKMAEAVVCPLESRLKDATQQAAVEQLGSKLTTVVAKLGD